MADPDDKPHYTLYRSKPKLFAAPRRRRRPGRHAGGSPPRGYEEPPPPRRRRRLPFPRRRPGAGRRIGVWRVAALARHRRSSPGWRSRSCCSWSPRRSSPSKVSSDADAELGGAGYPLTSAEHGPRARLRRPHQGLQGAGREQDRPGRSRSDSILLMRIGGGHNATLSIPRDTVVPIPGHGEDKINAAYAYGGPALAIRTVEQYLGIPVNHLVEVNFENFPQLIDALGGVTYRGGCVVSQDQRRLQERRLHAAPEGRRAGDQRQAGARARPHPQERVQRQGERPHPRPPPAEDPRLDQGQGHLRRDLRPPAVGLLGGARRRSAPTCPARRCSAWSAPSSPPAPPSRPCCKPDRRGHAAQRRPGPDRRRRHQARRGRALPAVARAARRRPARGASAASPNAWALASARLRNRCRSCSQVKPIPPWTCSAERQTLTAASLA